MCTTLHCEPGWVCAWNKTSSRAACVPKSTARPSESPALQPVPCGRGYCLPGWTCLEQQNACRKDSQPEGSTACGSGYCPADWSCTAEGMCRFSKNGTTPCGDGYCPAGTHCSASSGSSWVRRPRGRLLTTYSCYKDADPETVKIILSIGAAVLGVVFLASCVFKFRPKARPPILPPPVQRNYEMALT